MKRIGVFAFYDARGRADAYVDVLLEGIMEELDRLIIVVNGKVDDTSRIMFERYAADIFVRENRGYDGGAYKDVFLTYMADENWTEWDEIVLFNNTFYGPVHPFQKVFDVMKEQEGDFWGLVRHPGGGEILGKEITPHIQSYFLVCRKSLVCGPRFKEFWANMQYPQTYLDAINEFEIAFTRFFEREGFIGCAYTDLFSIEMVRGENICDYGICQLMKEIDFPIIKRKGLYYQWEEVLSYLRDETRYDEALIFENIRHFGTITEDGFLPFAEEDLLRFVRGCERIFLYGNGIWGERIRLFFEKRSWDYEAVLVTKKREGENVKEYADVEFEQGDGIVLCLGEKAKAEVYPVLQKAFSAEKLFCIL